MCAETQGVAPEMPMLAEPRGPRSAGVPAGASSPARALAETEWWAPGHQKGKLALQLAADGGSLALAALLLPVPWLGLTYAALALFALNVPPLSGTTVNPRMWLDAPKLACRLAVPLFVLAPLSLIFWSRQPAELGVLIAYLPVYLGLLLASRATFHALVRATRRRGRWLEPTIIIGAGAVACEAARILGEHPEYGMATVGFVDNSIPLLPLPAPFLGDIWDLDRILDVSRASRLLVAFGTCREHDMVHALRACEGHRVQIFVVPRLFEVGAHGTRHHAEEIWGLPLHALRGSMHARRRQAKRAFDVVVGSAIFVLVTPVLALTAVMVRASLGRPVLFRQIRIGEGGRSFELLKFRTLAPNNASDSQWNVADHQAGRLGKLLRRTGLDELPQLVNVLRGEMSLVGPRPERPSFVEKFSLEVPSYQDRHRVPAGITGWAQIHGLHGDTSIADRARFDNYYIENWSPWRDLAILLRTAVALKRSAKGRTSGGAQRSAPGQASAAATHGLGDSPEPDRGRVSERT